MADSQQNTDWSAIRLMALQCLSAAWDLAWWAETSQEGDYDAESAARHLEVIDRAHDTLYRAIRTFSGGIRVMLCDSWCESAHFDAIALASVGEGPRPDFRVGGICCATAHQTAYVLLRIALGQFEGAMMDDGIAAHFNYLQTPLPEALPDRLRTLSPEALRETLIHLEKVAHLSGLFAGQSGSVIRAWIDREWAAASGDATPPATESQPPASDDLPDELQELINDLPPDANLRVAYRRDHLWLKWKEQLSEKGRCNAQIRDRWIGLSDALRKIISPRLADSIGTARSGAETVRLGIYKANQELKEVKPKSVRRNAKKPRSRKKI